MHFRVLAPDHEGVTLVVDGRRHALSPEGDGHWSAAVEGAGPGSRYGFAPGDDPGPLPDPWSRFQPDGPHGLSEVVDPDRFPWSDQGWRGRPLEGAVVYELHVGTFAGTWASAAARLEHLRDLGVTVVQVLPVAEFPGRFGWGYDGVGWFAPYSGYGRPDDLRAFVDRAHALGLAVILDVVYNHTGPDGCYLSRFAKGYLSGADGEWGPQLAFDGPSPLARPLVIENAAYWIREFHLDGLRLDATQAIHDRSDDHVIGALTRAARAAGEGRRILVLGESEPQDPHLVRPPGQGGQGLDAIYDEDLHHTCFVALTGRTEGYFSEYGGSPQELVSAVKHGFLFQGQRYHWQDERRGRPALGMPRMRGVGFLENHDQVANTATAERLWRLGSPGRYRALVTLLLCGPWTPLLFQGQEWSSSRPFHYFAAHGPELAAAVREGRAAFMSQFPSVGGRPEGLAALPDPADPRTFEACRLDWAELEREGHAAALALHRDLLALRRSDPVLATQGQPPVGIDGAVLGAEAFLLRWLHPEGDDRLLVVNLGRELRLVPAPEPLLAPPEGARWSTRLSSDDRRYGGPGARDPEGEDGGWVLPAQAACLLGATPHQDP